MRFLIPAVFFAALVFSGGVALAADAAAPVSPPQASEVELEFWRSIRDNRIEELNAYLTKYPNGAFRSLALARIAVIQNNSPTAAPNPATGVASSSPVRDAGDQVSEDQIGLDKDQRGDVQRRLNDLGSDLKVTGTFDDETRSAISRWQTARGFPVTGYLNRLQHKTMQAQVASTRVASSNAATDEPARRRSLSSNSNEHRYRSSGGGGRGDNGMDGAGAILGNMMGGRGRMMGGLFGR